MALLSPATHQLLDYTVGELYEAATAAKQPHVRLRPRITQDGDQWCAALGGIRDGVVGFGDTPELAAAAFDAAWRGEADAERLILESKSKGIEAEGQTHRADELLALLQEVWEVLEEHVHVEYDDGPPAPGEPGMCAVCKVDWPCPEAALLQKIDPAVSER